ncbi:heparinase II/III family protein [Roseobacter weihaiensis]|uniref:heparinase II/III family protein n=1 Tax=Roseobacter weihaiensis TaxID=2763262 RepID=UPI001D0B2A55|nr:heparinase II/III family protein [Roseobacter sp. H9]
MKHAALSDVPLTDASAEEIRKILRDTKGASPLPPRADRAAWAVLGQQHVAAEILTRGEALRAAPVPSLPLSLYLDYHRTGRRTGYEGPLDARRDRLVQLTLAECLAGDGGYLDAIADTLDAILNEPTWIVPAHGFGFSDGLPPPDLQSIDLWSAMACLLVAEVDHLLDDALHPVLRARVREVVDMRGITPLLARDDMRWMGAAETGRCSPNWAPVCAGLTAGAAIYLEPDTDRLARVLAKALREIAHYRDHFPPDGGCAEGVGYWEKGIFATAAFAELVAARTEGRIDPLVHPRFRTIAGFPLAVHLGPQVFPAFSDTDRGRSVQTALLRHLARRLDLAALAAVDPSGEAGRRLTTRYPAEQIRDLTWWEDAGPAHDAAEAEWLPDTQIFIARLDPADPDALTLAVKGGHNAEPHNHNDVGSFVIRAGGTTAVAELGAGVYTRDTFRPEARYDQPMYGSQGHSVPVIGGRGQRTGRVAAAGKVTCEGDRLSLDLAACYPPELGLATLLRSVALDRQQGAVRVTDIALFDGPVLPLVSAVMTFEMPQTLAPGRIRLGSLILEHDPALTIRTETLPGLQFRDGSTADAYRILVTALQSDAPDVTLVFRPITARSSA